MNPGKQRISKIIILALLLCTSRAFAYDYPWAVEYEIKEDSLEKINTIVQDFVLANPDMQVFGFDEWVSEQYEPKNNELRVGRELCILLLAEEEYIPFGQVLCGSIYLKECGCSVSFYIPYVPGKKKNYIRFVSYNDKIEMVEGKAVINFKAKGKSFLFNDVEPTKQEIPIKESFEKNFLSKLPLEFEYQKPAALDRFLSKLITTLFRPRKNFVDN